MAISTMLTSLSVCLLLLLGQYGSMAQTRYRRQNQCRLERLNTLQPTRRVQSEAGETEFFEDKDDQLQCAGVSVYRRRIQHRGLLLPHFSNTPRIVYVIEGKGVAGYLIPGCPESFQMFQQRGSRMEEFRHGQGEQSFRDQHQRHRRFKQGDILVIPAGVAFWAFNNGQSPLVTITVADTSSSSNQLDDEHRQFQLAGSQRSGGEHNTNFFGAFNTEFLAESLGVPRELAQRIQKDDSRGEIVKVKGELDVVWPSSPRGGEEKGEESEERARREEEEYGGSREGRSNGFEQLFCSSRFIENIDDPRHADFFNPSAGWLTHINSLKLPSLRFVQLSATRGVLRRRAFVAPHWNINAHSLMYVTRGQARVQIVDDRARLVFNGQLQQGQLLFIPQNFVVLKQAGEDGFEYVSFKTNGDAHVSQITGKGSIFKGLPEDVLATSFQLNREEAKQLKYARAEQIAIFPAESMHQRQGRSFDFGAAAIREVFSL